VPGLQRPPAARQRPGRAHSGKAVAVLPERLAVLKADRRGDRGGCWGDVRCLAHVGLAHTGVLTGVCAGCEQTREVDQAGLVVAHQVDVPGRQRAGRGRPHCRGSHRPPRRRWGPGR